VSSRSYVIEGRLVPVRWRGVEQSAAREEAATAAEAIHCAVHGANIFSAGGLDEKVRMLGALLMDRHSTDPKRELSDSQ